MLTGYYIDENDLKAYMPASELLSITENIDGDVTNVQKAIINVCSLADTYLQRNYDLPLKECFVTNALKSRIAHWVIWDLTGNYSSVSEETKKVREKNYDEAIKFFKDLANGTLQLTCSDDTDALSEADKYFFDSNQRIDRDFH